MFLNNEPLTVVHPGSQRRIFTHVLDIVAGVLLVAEKGNGDGYLLNGDSNVSIFELVRLFGKEMRFIMLPERRGERFSSSAGESRARTELAWAPTISLADYIAKFIESVHTADNFDIEI